MGMDQYFTVGQPWPKQREPFCELRNCRALDYAMRLHGQDRQYLRGDFKSTRVTAFTVNSIMEALRSHSI